MKVAIIVSVIVACFATSALFRSFRHISPPPPPLLISLLSSFSSFIFNGQGSSSI